MILALVTRNRYVHGKRLIPYLAAGNLLISWIAHSQEGHPSFERISTQHGLSQVSVYAIVQDPQGFLWFGTEDGLNRYDGYTFTVYRHNPLDTTSLSNSWVECLYVDRSGELWIGTWGGGVNRYDRLRDRFLRFTSDPRDPESLSNNFIQTIFEDHSGTIWIGTEKGLNRFDLTRGTFVRYFQDPNDGKSLTHDNVRSICQDRRGDLWVGTFVGVSRYDQKRKEFLRYVHDPRNPRSLSHNRIRSVYQDRAGTIWIGTRAGLDMYDRTSDSFVRLPLVASSGKAFTAENVFRIFEDRNGTLWIGTNDSGLVRYDRKNNRVSHHPHNPYDPQSLSVNPVRSIIQDRSGVLWIGTLGGGLNRYTGAEERFVHIRHEPDKSNSLSGKIVFSIYLDRSGVLWIGTDMAGLNAYDSKQNRFVHYKHDPNNPHSLGVNSVRSIYGDKDGILWIGTVNGGLNQYDRKRNRFVRHEHDPNDRSSISSNSIRTIYEDSQGMLWIGTWGGGLNQYDKRRNRFTHYRHQPNDPASLSSDLVSSILEDRTGVLWVTTREGLNRFDRHKNIFVRYVADLTDPHALSNNYILSIHEDRNGNLWLGTMMGLNKLDKTTNRFERFFEQDGLPSNVVYGILEDEQGFLWLSTNHGLSKFDPATGRFRNYDSRDGLQADEFNSGAYHKGRDGRLYFGGVNGVTAFHPDSVKDNLLVPPVVLTSFRVFEQPLRLEQSIWATRELRLSYAENFFSFEFAALDFTAPEKNQYAYMLEGFDKDWVLSGARRYASYTNVDPGEYVFRVKGSNNDGVWNEAGLELRITIVPLFWQTWWVRVLASLSLIGALVALYHYRAQRLLYGERMRARIATDLHDDIGTSLTSIAITSDLSQRELERDPNKTAKLLERISETSRELLDTMNDIVWSINPDNDSLDLTILRMQEFAVRLCEAKEIGVRFTTPPNLADLRLSMDVRRAVFLIFKEIVNNMVKHADCTNADIEIGIDAAGMRGRKRTLWLRVKDDGKGFSFTEPVRGNGIRNMHKRVDAVGGSVVVRSSPGSGTEIHLRVPVRIT